MISAQKRRFISHLVQGTALTTCCVTTCFCHISPCRAAAAAAEFAQTEQFLLDTVPQMATAPDQVAVKLKAWIDANPKADLRSIMSVFDRLIYVQMVPLHDLPAAYATSQQGVDRLAQSIYTPHMVARQMQVLLAQNKPADAEAEGAKYNDAAAAAGNSSVAAFYAEALQQENKSDQLVAWCKQTMLKYPLLLSQTGDSISPPLYTPVINALLGSGHEDQALQWAKLQFAMCQFTDSAIKGATDQMAKAIVAKNLSSADMQAFLDSEKDPTKPNPMASVALPISADEAKQALAALPADSVHPKARINLLLVAGANRDAMLLARQHLIENMGSADGVDDICRVFKAVDLNLKRANDFLTFMKQGGATNPVTEFLKASPAAG